jgi:hypothetical protein
MHPWNPKKLLEEGAKLLAPVLAGHGFVFRHISSGIGSGGDYAEGRMEALPRAIELHFRNTLGLVRFHYGSSSVAHAHYMTYLGVADRCEYPGYSEDRMYGFRHLAHDIQAFGADFFGSAENLIAASKIEAEEEAAKAQQWQVGASGDARARLMAREAFRCGDYPNTIRLLTNLQFPGELSSSELKFLSIARKRMSEQ